MPWKLPKLPWTLVVFYGNFSGKFEAWCTSEFFKDLKKFEFFKDLFGINCTEINQSQSSNIFMYIIIKVAL
jgi:hypothetical protein